MTSPLSPELAALDFDAPTDAECECPACFAHPGRKCYLLARWRTALHEIHGCDRPDLTPPPTTDADPPAGAAIRLLCDDCLGWHRKRAEELAQRARQILAQTGGVLVCRVCQMPLTDVDSYLHVEAFHGL